VEHRTEASPAVAYRGRVPERAAKRRTYARHTAGDVAGDGCSLDKDAHGPEITMDEDPTVTSHDVPLPARLLDPQLGLLDRLANQSLGQGSRLLDNRVTIDGSF
jgi:hypothetical protein